MNFIVNVLIIVVIFLAIFGINVNAQTDFSGTWNLKEKQHVKGPEYSNGAPAAFKVKQTKDSIIITYPEDNARIAFSQNGKTATSKSKTSGRKIIRSLKWSADKKVVTFTSDIHKVDNENEIELTRIDEWKLSDGKLNFNCRSIETITESWEVKATYEKQ